MSIAAERGQSKAAVPGSFVDRLRRIPADDLARLSGMVGAGLSVSEIARQLGVTPPAIAYHCKRRGLTPDDGRHQRHRTSLVDAVLAAIECGGTFRQVADRYGLSLGQVAGIRFRSQRASR